MEEPGGDDFEVFADECDTKPATKVLILNYLGRGEIWQGLFPPDASSPLPRR
jgi:hypothetical protein